MEKKDPTEHRTLDEYGVIFVSGEIDSGEAESVCQKIIEFNISQEANSIQLIINSPGGLCASGFAVIDLMDWSRLPVYTTGVGIIGSMALCVFMAGEAGRRVLTPRTSILSHRFSGFNWGNHSELVARRREEDLMHHRLIDHYLRHTGLNTEEEVVEKLLRDTDTWLTPSEAIELGIADIIQQDRKPVMKREEG
jgi:ATP-dependent Clp protease, protease subunit